MKPFIVLFGDTYYPAAWSDYAGEADTFEEAEEVARFRASQQGERSPNYWWWEIIDLRTKQVVKRS